MTKSIEQNTLNKIFNKNNNPSDYFINYGLYLKELIDKLDYDQIAIVLDCFCEARERDGTIFFAGNGGSAATASHFTQDLAEVCKKTGGKCFKTLSLTENVSYITALGNDYGYDTIFTGQLKNLFKSGDVLVAISASGNSPNVVEAVKMAKKLGGVTVGLVGFDGGKLAVLCDKVIHIASNKGEYGPVEDLHLVVDHMITSFLTWKDMCGEE